MDKYPRLIVEKVWDDDHIISNALQEASIDLPGDVDRGVCFFLAQLIEKFWRKFELKDSDIHFLLTKKMSIDVTMSGSTLESVMSMKEAC